MRLADKTVVITGAGHGLGAATVDLFMRQGANVVAVDKDEQALFATLSGFGEKAQAVPADVTNEREMQEVVERARHKYGRVDGLVHYAGITRDALFLRMNLSDFEEVLHVNLTGSFVAARAVSAVMARQESGSIVFTSSRVYLGNIGQANYAASKGGVVSLCRTLALELAPHNIRINALAPGFIDTRMTKAVPAKIREKALASIPLRRVGQPKEVAQAALFLISDDASYITGQTLFVDGGRTTGLAQA